MLKFIVVSDCHLVPPGDRSHSIDTFERLEKAVEMIVDRHADAAFLVLNGDLVDHGDIAAYERLQDALSRLPMKCYFTLGNHDNAQNFRQVFGAEHAVFDHVISADDHRIIVLNTQDEGKVSGILDDAQLTWLNSELKLAKGHPTILVLHHPIAEMGTGTDFIRLQNAEEIFDSLKAHGDIRQIISGHVHATTTGMIHGIPFSSIGGNHYAFDSFSSPEIGDMARIEGPGQMGVVLSDAQSTVLHFENFWDKNDVMSPEHFTWKG